MATRALSRRDAMLAKVRGDETPWIPFATYNLHPYGPHASDPSYAGLLERVVAKAGMLVKHEPRHVGDAAGDHETTVERSSAGIRTTTVWHTPKGDLRSVFVTPPAQPGYTIEPFIKSDDDIERAISAPRACHEYDLTETRRLLEALGDRGVLYVSYPDPMYAAASLFDFEDFVVRCVTDPDRIQGLTDALAEGIFRQTERLAEAFRGLPVLFYTAGPEVATPPMLPPSVFARLVTPYQKRLIAILRAAGHQTCIHCHGRVRLVLDEILETGTDALEPIEPPVQGDISLSELLERVRGRICLMGYIQDQDFHLCQPGEMRRRVAEIAATVPPTARYVMMPTCTPFQFPATARYVAAYMEWIEAAAELL